MTGMNIWALGKVALALLRSRESCLSRRDGLDCSLLLRPKDKITFCVVDVIGVLCFNKWAACVM